MFVYSYGSFFVCVVLVAAKLPALSLSPIRYVQQPFHRWRAEKARRHPIHLGANPIRPNRGTSQDIPAWADLPKQQRNKLQLCVCLLQINLRDASETKQLEFDQRLKRSFFPPLCLEEEHTHQRASVGR